MLHRSKMPTPFVQESALQKHLKTAIRTFLALPLLAGVLLAGTTTMAQAASLEHAMAKNARALGTQLVMRGEERGARLLHQVASQGDPKAQFNLAVAYMRGDVRGGPRPNIALHWYGQAAAAGYAPAAYNAGVLHASHRVRNASPAHATYWMCRAAVMRHQGALRWLHRNRGGFATCSQ